MEYICGMTYAPFAMKGIYQEKSAFDSLKKMGVVLKRAHYFITCGGKQMYHTPIEEAYITRQLIHVDTKDLWKMQHANETYSQMTLADFGIG